MTRASTCYMCDSPETSREHAPPLCFFPETKDVGRDLRRNLVTVPSCDVHNSKKSKDDEFFRSLVLMAAAQIVTQDGTCFLGRCFARQQGCHIRTDYFLAIRGRLPRKGGVFCRSIGTALILVLIIWQGRSSMTPIGGNGACQQLLFPQTFSAGSPQIKLFHISRL
jgi:hypothetical protein